MVSETICECGLIVKGSSDKHLQYNLKAHKRGWRHKEIMLNKKEGVEKD